MTAANMSGQPNVPTFRGLLHLWGAIAVIPIALSLYLLSARPEHYVGTSVYVAGLLAMFGASAAYHRGTWKPTTKRILQRLDHSTIFVGIAGTYTPIALMALHGWALVLLLSLVWGATGVGIVLQWLPVQPSRAIAALAYAVVGWSAVVALPQLVHGLGWLAFLFVLGGGLAYTAGSVVYALKRPNPSPTVFGFHEVFHMLTLVGASCHLTAILLTMIRQR
jgi:hemolysin III